ncbi:MAG: oligosaccharide flippase family protein [Elusimicrobia bacterium]|nr:oligosaccharide flippase family protein [Elusimicrobiota bacterium]
MSGTEATPVSVGLRMLSGVELSMLGQAAVLAVNLSLTPMIVHGLGAEGYGLFTLMWTALSFLLLLNAGTGVATQTFAAEYRGRGEPPDLRRLLRRAFLFQMGMGALGAAALFGARHWLVLHWLNFEGPAEAAASRVLAWVALAAPAFFALQFSVNILYGTQRFKAYNAFTALQVALVAVSAALLLKLGLGLAAVAGAFAAAHWALAAAGLWSVRSLWAGSEAPSCGRVSEFVSFSGKNLLSQALWLLTNQGDRVFVASYMPLSAMSYYAVSSSIAQKFNVFCGAVSAAAFPLLAELHGLGEEERLKRLYLKATQLSLYLILPVSILAFVLVPQFMTLWLGPDFGLRSTWPFRLLVVANIAYLFTYLPNALAVGKGSPQLSAYMGAAKTSVLLVGWPLLIPRWGIVGAALGVVAAEWAVTPLFVAHVHRKVLAVSWAEYWSRACLRPCAAGLALAAFGLAFHGRIGDWVELLGFAAAATALYGLLAYGLLEKDAKDLLAQWLRARLGAA